MIDTNIAAGLAEVRASSASTPAPNLSEQFKALGASSMSHWKIIGSPVFIPGHIHGSRHATAAFLFTSAPLAVEMATLLDRLVEETFGPLPNIGDRAPAQPGTSLREPDATGRWLLETLHRLQVLAATPIFEMARLLDAPGDSWRCLVPCRSQDFALTMALVQALLDVLNAVQDDRPTAGPRAELKAAHSRLRENQSPDYSMLSFARAAAERRIPTQELARGTVQFGIGAKSRWLDGSFTDSTPTVATKLARDKHAAAQMLRRAGIPIPDHKLALSADQAVEIAARLNYPVVVKPADLDGGRGVAAGLIDEQEVRQAYDACRALSSNVLVERHVEGRDYRIIVFEDRALFAVERVPGGVTGNGTDSVENLIADFNLVPFRVGPNAPLGKLSIDDEARLLLARQGYSLSSVPEPNQFVRLRRAANIASGGVPVAVFAEAHPDNLDLAVRSARALRLDLAGIDLLLPNIERSWRETGGAICEVNARPNLGQLTTAHLYGEILDRMVEGSGRIPVVVVLGAEQPMAVAAAIERSLSAGGRIVGCFDSRELRIGGVPFGPEITTALKAGQAMATDNRVEIAIICITDVSPLLTGLPFDSYDLLILAGSHVEANGRGPQVGIEQIVQNVLPACDGVVLPVETSFDSIQRRDRHGSSRWEKPVSAEGLPDRVAELLRHRALG